MIAHRPWLGVSTRDWFINSDTPHREARRAVEVATIGVRDLNAPNGRIAH
jgi:hypothetical protein